MRANDLTSASPPSPAAETCAIPCFKGELVARLRKDMPDGEALEHAQVLFSALAGTARLKILHALAGGEELCVCDVAHLLGASISAASHHLRKLRDLRILKYRNDGKMAYYSVRDPLAADFVRLALSGGAR